MNKVSGVIEDIDYNSNFGIVRIGTYIYVDASHNRLREILIQRGNMILCASKLLKDYESRYFTHNLELITVIFVLKVGDRVRYNIYISMTRI